MKTSFVKHSISLDLAQKLANLSVKKAKELECNVSVSIVDESGLPKLFIRMDKAPLLSREVAFKKAYTSICTSSALSSEDFFNATIKKNYGSVVYSTLTDVTPLSAGFPIKVDGIAIGAIGVSGASSDQDVQIAQYALFNMADETL